MIRWHTVSVLAAHTARPAIWPARERVNVLWEKEIACCLAFPRPYRWRAMAARHGSLGCQEMVIIAGTPQLSVPLSPLCKVLLFVLRNIFFQKDVHV
ncbi:Hypothetical predicted protein [Scomber scombrus]|uniref:Secreted protein n=1 Tax=Scomber scombrus TaxID=13677 RepID=A0AAV1PS64_SCOSC